MTTIDIITAAGPGSEEFLADLAASLRELHPVEGWKWNWLVVADGTDANENLARAQQASQLGANRVWSNHTRYWAGASRNRALANATGEWIVTVDADDRLTPEALQAWVQAVTDSSEGSWLAFPILDWYPEEERVVTFPDPRGPGRIPAGYWLDYFEEHNSHPIAPVAVLWPKWMLMTIGGWGANPAAEDAMPTLVGSSRWDGWWQPTATHLYRKHPGQITHGGSDRPVAAAAQDGRRLAVEQARLWLTAKTEPIPTNKAGNDCCNSDSYSTLMDGAEDFPPSIWVSRGYGGRRI